MYTKLDTFLKQGVLSQRHSQSEVKTTKSEPSAVFQAQADEIRRNKSNTEDGEH